MITELTQQAQSVFMRNAQLCLALFGYIMLAVSGGLLVRWSLKYATVGKFTYTGASAIILALVMIGRTCVELARKKQGKSNQFARD